MRRRIRLSGGPRRRAQPAAAAGNGAYFHGNGISAAGGHERTRSAARSVPRRGLVADLPRPYSRKHRQLVHHPQLWIQRRHRDLHLHFRLYRCLRLRPHHARARLPALQRPHPAARLADLCRAYFSVHHLHGGDRLRRGDLRQSAVRRGNENPRFSQAARRHHLSSAVAEVQARQHGRAAALHRAAAAVSADAVCAVAAPPTWRWPDRPWFTR